MLIFVRSTEPTENINICALSRNSKGSEHTYFMNHGKLAMSKVKYTLYTWQLSLDIFTAVLKAMYC